MRKKALLKSKAIRLRKQGLSYSEIRKTVLVSKSSLSLWLKGIWLKKEYRERLYTKQIRILELGAQCQKERRMREIERILETARQEIIIPITSETHKLFGAALYWAEGSKGKNFEVTNSDPNLILFMVKWFEKTFNVKPNVLKAHLNIYEQQSENDIKKFWSTLCGIPIENFGKSFVKPKNRGYKKNNLYYGTIKIRVPCGTDMRWRVFGWIQKILCSIKPDIERTQRKWEYLKKVSRAVNLETIPPIA